MSENQNDDCGEPRCANCNGSFHVGFEGGPDRANLCKSCALPRIFALRRVKDATGVSGTGHVADGVLFPDGTVAVRWRTLTASTSVYDSLAAVERIHGHGGDTVIDFFDQVAREAAITCYQDDCENVAFSSLGGLGMRSDPPAQRKYVERYTVTAYADEWRRGYIEQAERQYGADWRTCIFGWVPAMTIGAGR